LFKLEFKVVGVEDEKRLSVANAIPVLDEPLRHLAVYPEPEVAFGARPDGRGEAAGLREALVLDGGDQNRALGRLPGRSLFPDSRIAAADQSSQEQRTKCCDDDVSAHDPILWLRPRRCGLAR
jgi:hypothetical protein